MVKYIVVDNYGGNGTEFCDCMDKVHKQIGFLIEEEEIPIEYIIVYELKQKYSVKVETKPTYALSKI